MVHLIRWTHEIVKLATATTIFKIVLRLLPAGKLYIASIVADYMLVVGKGAMRGAGFLSDGFGCTIYLASTQCLQPIARQDHALLPIRYLE